MKNREQTYYILGALILVALLYWGFDTKPSTQKTLEKSRVLNTPELDIHTLQENAKSNLSPENLNALETLETQLEFADADTVKLNLMKDLSGYWFQLQQPMLAGHYARQVAEVAQTAASWSIAGTTFASALTREGIEEKDKIIAREQAIDAFEKAISLEPGVVEHRINQALCYIEAPDQAQPMKGVQMLAALAKSNPDSHLPLYHLARLSLRTGQIENAEQRIEQALQLDSTNARIACLAIDIYNQASKPEEARKWSDLCATLK